MATIRRKSLSLYPIPISVTANRSLHAGLSSAIATVLAICAVVQPSPTGKGTHERLGLPKCVVCRLTGVEQCPSCGLTTGFCHILRGHFEQARMCNAAAIPVFGLCAAVMLYCTVIAIMGKQWLWQEIFILAILMLLLSGCWFGAFMREYERASIQPSKPLIEREIRHESRWTSMVPAG
jgi:hypothetical protein